MSCNTPGNSGIPDNITSIANVWAQQAQANPSSSQSKVAMEAFIKAKQKKEEQADYMFIQRIIKELTQSCALNMPIPAAAIPEYVVLAELRLCF